MKKPRAPKLVTIAITTTITVIFWIFFTLYQVLTTKPTPSVEKELLEPIDPKLNTGVLDKLDEKVFFEEGSFTPIQITQPNPPELTPETEPEITPEEEASTQTATEESQLNQ